MSSVVIAGDSSGSITLSAPNDTVNAYTLTLPMATDMLVGKNTVDTLTNKTFTSPVLVAPQLGMPASGDLSNCVLPRQSFYGFNLSTDKLSLNYDVTLNNSDVANYATWTTSQTVSFQIINNQLTMVLL